MKAARLSLIATSSRCGDIGVEVGIGAGIWGNGLPGGMQVGSKDEPLKRPKGFDSFGSFVFLAIDVGTIVTTVVLAIANRALHALNYVFGIGCVTL